MSRCSVSLRPLKVRLLLVPLAAALALCTTALAQDPHLSQYFSAQQYLNPAMTGLFNGKLRAHLHSRSQWASIIKNPYITNLASVAMPMKPESKLKNMAAGALVMNDVAGSGSFNYFNFLLSASYDMGLFRTKLHRVAAGLQAGLSHKSIDFSRLFFGDQYSPLNGGSYSGTSSEQLSAGRHSDLTYDINAGIVYYFSGRANRFNPFAGASVFHLTQPNESIYNLTNKEPQRFSLHGGFKINLGEKLQITPQGLYMKQTNATELLGDLLIHYKLGGMGNFLFGGGAIRKGDASVAHLGLVHGRYTYHLSYDINTSSLEPYSGKRGGVEFSLTYILFTPPEAPVIKACPGI